MHNDLIERYIYAVTRRLPHKMQADVEKELRSIIVDMLEARCRDLPPSEHDVRVVLAELGTPNELARKYHPVDERSLIGPRYYGSYIMMLRIVLACTAFGITVAGIVQALLGPSDAGAAISSLWQWMGMIINSAVYIFTAITIIFMVFERRGVPFKMDDDNISDLPPVPNRNERIPRWEPVAAIALNVLFAVVFIAAPQIVGFWLNGAWTPLLDADAVRPVWYIVITFALIGIVKEAAKLHDGRYTTRVAFISIAGDLISVPLAIVFFNTGWKLNLVFSTALRGLLDSEAGIINAMLDNFGAVALAVVLIALALDIGTMAVRAIRAGRRG